jgi:hypothetical protein
LQPQRGSYPMKVKYAALQLIGVLTLTISLAGCGSELTTAITDCQLDAHREIVETRNQSEEKRKFALGEFSDACIKKKGFKPTDRKPGCLIEPVSPDDGRSFIKPAAECWSR